MITGWRGALGSTAEVGNDHSWDGAVYKGLAIGTADVGAGPQQYLYATDFHNGKIDVFDNAFADQMWAGASPTRSCPKGYAPFGIQNLNGMIFVTYAKQAGQRRRASRATAAASSTRSRRLDVPRPGRHAWAR